MPILRNITNEFFAPLKTDFAFLNIDDDPIGLINEDVAIRRNETRVDDPPP